MTDKLWDALLATAQQLNVTQEGTATGGTTTTLLDSVARTIEVDNYWIGGTIWYVDADGDETYNNYCTVISDSAQSTGTITWTTAQTQAPESGERYIVANGKFPLSMLKSAVNTVLSTAMILDIDETVSIEESKTEYTLPTTIYRGNLIKVYIQGETDDDDDNWWEEIHDWRVEDGDAGSADTLILSQQYPSAYTLQLHFLKYHGAVTSLSGNINEVVDLQGLGVRAALNCVLQRMTDNRKDEWLGQLANMLIAKQQIVPLVRKVYRKRTNRRPYIERKDNT